MQFAASFCLLCIVNAATNKVGQGNTQKLKEVTFHMNDLLDRVHRDRHHNSNFLRKHQASATSVQALRGSAHLQASKKPWLLKKAETVHDDWIKPVSSIKNFLMANQTEIIVSALIWFTFALVVAFLYKRSARYDLDMGSKHADSVDPVEFSTWRTEWYQCYQYPEIFFWSCCCPCIRWGHTMDLLQFVDYWPAFFLFFLLVAMNQITGFVVFGIFLTVILVYYRQKTRKLFGMENYSTSSGLTVDCLGYCFCWPCFIAQEANHVTQATRLGWTKELAEKTTLFNGRLEPSASQEG